MVKQLSLVTPSHHSNLLELIQSQLGSFHASEIAIEEAILKDPQLIAPMNITQLASHSKTSVSSVVRLVRL